MMRNPPKKGPYDIHVQGRLYYMRAVKAQISLIRAFVACFKKKMDAAEYIDGTENLGPVSQSLLREKSTLTKD